MKRLAYLGIAIGGLIGGYAGSWLDHGNSLGGWAILGSALGSFAGIWLAYRLSRS